MDWRIPNDVAILTCEYILKCCLNIGRIESRCLDEAESVAFGEGLCLVCGHSTQVSQVALVTDQHYHDILIGMVAQLAQPSLDVLISQMLGDVVHEQSPNSPAVVSRCNGPVTLLTG